MLALGAAMALGNAAALLRPPRKRDAHGAVVRPPLLRTLAYACVGALAALWALASLLSQ